VRGVSRIEEPQARPVEADPIEVHIIRIFPRLVAAGVEVEDARFFVDADDALAGELSGRELGP